MTFPVKITKSESGYLLVEAIVAASLLIIGLVSVAGLMARALSLNRVVSDQFIANYLTVEGIEVVKNLIEANILAGNAWNSGISNGCYEVDYLTFSLNNTCNSSSESNQPLSFDSATGFYSYSSGNQTPFLRSILIENSSDGNRIKVNSIVKWVGRGGIEFNIDLEDYFFNYR